MLAVVAIATVVAASQRRRRDLRALAVLLVLGIPAAGGDRRGQRAHRPQPVGGVPAPAGLAGHHRAGRAVPLAPRAPRHARRPAGRAGRLGGAGDVRGRLGRALPRHGRDRGGSARRRPHRPAQRAEPAAGLPAARRPGVPLRGPDASACSSPCTPPAPRAGAVRAVRVLLVVELAQGTIGFVQYFTGVPVVLVGVPPAGSRADLGDAWPGPCWRPGARRSTEPGPGCSQTGRDPFGSYCGAVGGTHRGACATVAIPPSSVG